VSEIIFENGEPRLTGTVGHLRMVQRYLQDCSQGWHKDAGWHESYHQYDQLPQADKDMILAYDWPVVRESSLVISVGHIDCSCGWWVDLDRVDRTCDACGTQYVLTLTPAPTSPSGEE
jgi:hypothetical protein